MVNNYKGRGPLVLASTIIGWIIGWQFLAEPSSSTNFPTYEAYAASLDEICTAGGEGVVLSPSGKYATFDQGVYRQTSVVPQGSRLAILDIPCAVSQASLKQCLTGIGAFSNIRDLAWSHDETSLYAVENNSTLMRIGFSSVDGRSVARVLERAPLLSQDVGLYAMRLGTTSANSVHEENELLEQGRRAAINGLPANEFIPIGIFIGPNGWYGALLEEQRNLQLHVTINGTRKPTPLKSREVPTARLVTRKLPMRHMNHDVFIADPGVFFDVGDDYPKASVTRQFTKPIISSRDGSYLGEFSKFSVDISDVVENKNSIINQVNKRLIANPGYYIKSLSVTKNGDYAYILKDIDGRKEIGASNGDRLVYNYCHNGNAQARAQLPLEIRNLSVGEKGRGLYGTLITHARGRGLVVFFGGGPLNNVENYPYSVRQYLQLGWDVFAVNYSGSTGNGPGVSSRLHVEGLANSLIKDAKLVADYLGKVSNDKKVIIHGESFGSLPAVAIDKYIKRPHRLILVAPFLRHQPPEAWANKDSTMASFFGKVNTSYQKRYEAAIIGPEAAAPSGLQPEQDKILGLLSSRTPVLTIFAKEDYMSSEAHLPELWKRSTLTTKTILGTHDFITAQSETWSLIDSWLSETD